MHTQLSRQGARCVQLVYERIDEALDMLHVKPRFDVCVLQSYFDIVPLGLLAYLRERCSGLVVDGARIAGVDVDAVASDWRGAMDLALEQLHAAGHERIGFVTWPGDTQPLEGLRHHFVSLRQCLQRTASTMPLVTLGHMPRPGESSAALVSATLDSLGLGRRQAPTALVVWAGAQADALETALQRLPAKARQSARIILLGHVNRPEDHLSQFDIVGSNSDDAADSLVQCIRRRIEEPQQPHKTIYLTNHYVQFATGARPRVKTMLRGNARQIRSSTTIACNSRR